MTHSESPVWKVRCQIYFSTNKNSAFVVEGRNTKGGDHAEIDAIKKYKDRVSKFSDGENVVHISAALNLPCCDKCARALCDIGIEKIDRLHDDGCLQIAQIKWIGPIRAGMEVFKLAGISMTPGYQSMVMTEEEHLWVEEFLEQKVSERYSTTVAEDAADMG